MTTPVAIVGLSFDGVDLQRSDLQIFIEIAQGLDTTPSVRGVDVTVPALAGRIEMNRVNDVLPIVLEGLVMGNPAATSTADARESCQANRATVRALFASNRARAALTATPPGGVAVTIQARPMPGIIWAELVAGELYRVSIELEGYDDWAPA